MTVVTTRSSVILGLALLLLLAPPAMAQCPTVQYPLWGGPLTLNTGGTFYDTSLYICTTQAPLFLVEGGTLARLVLVHDGALANQRIFEIVNHNGTLTIRLDNDAVTSSSNLVGTDFEGNWDVYGSYLRIYATNYMPTAVPMQFHHSGPHTIGTTGVHIVDIPGEADTEPGVGGTAIVRGDDASGNSWVDVISFALGTSTVNVLSALARSGTPAARTYQTVGTQVILTMASGSYTVYIATSLI